MRLTWFLILPFLLCDTTLQVVVSAEIIRIEASPPQVALRGKDSSIQLLITGFDATGHAQDLTHQARYRHSATGADISSTGIVRGILDGASIITARYAGRSIKIPVSITDAQIRQPLSFTNDIIPILSRYRCNTSGCHGKAEGQNGFKLSVFGFDPLADYRAITMEARGRRIFPAAAEMSLLMQKMSGDLPHGGGILIPSSRAEYRKITEWIAAGVPWENKDDVTVVSISLTPDQRILRMGETQQLRVMAKMSNAENVDVTELAQFQSNATSQASVNADGQVTVGQKPGVVAVMATYMGSVDVFRIFIPEGDPIQEYPVVTSSNEIDESIYRQLQKMNIIASGTCTDEQFLRRVFIDLTGTVPTADQTALFLSDQDPDKRDKLVDERLESPEFNSYWALKWSDLLRVDRQTLGHENAYQYYSWIKESFRQHKPMDKFARELITTSGPLVDAPAGFFYKAVKSPNRMASTMSQVLLGIRIECAECHHHPFDRWGQTDFYGMRAFFAQVRYKKSSRGEMLIAQGNPVTKHPRTGETIQAFALGTQMPTVNPLNDRRDELANWLTAPENPWFASNIANRTWAHLMGRGIIEPVDDVRLTNPPTNPELLEGLTKAFVGAEFDFRKLLKLIIQTDAYQRSSAVNETNERDEQNYSRFLFKQLEAEVMLDAICQTTGVAEKFQGVPVGSRAIDLWDSSVPHYFLETFGRPVRATACECERISEPTVSQVLHILNSPGIENKLSHEAGTIRQIASDYEDNEIAIQRLYLTFFNRYGDKQEIATAVQYVTHGSNRRQSLEDIAWSMLNSLEFLFNH
ncbi:MAG: DUF1553 domain-containing protein [Planctomycetaceae bacterium]|nr:DUF1553 domain-containing protein [Planctomycetaceae bacterium]MBT7916894.1 DUF1553 domain-containing protein [Planctomycetaceae bacterium]